MAYILALDQGTTSSRAILFDEAGAIAAVAQHEFQQFYPQAGWVEHDPAKSSPARWAARWRRWARRARGRAMWPRSALPTSARRSLCGSARRASRFIRRLSGRTGARPRLQELEDSGAGETVAAKTGLVLDPYFSATKMKWILDNVTGARARAERGELAFGTVDSWLIWHLTGGKRHVTDVTNASRTLLYNIVKGEWDEEMLRLFDVPASMLPEVAWSSERVGEVTTTLGLGGVPIAGIAGDQQAALFGQLCWSAGEAKNTYGTGCFLLQNVGTEFVRSKHRLITTVAASAQKRLEYALEGSIFIGGAVVQWLRDNLQADRRVGGSGSACGERAGYGRRGFCAGVCGPRRAALGRARGGHADRPAARHQPGTLRGRRLKPSRFRWPMCWKPCTAKPETPLNALRVDGGAAVNDLLMQFQADVLGVPVVRPRVTETTALGAAYLAGLATGFWASPEDLRASGRGDVRFEPRMERE